MFVANLWHSETTSITQLATMGHDYAKLFDELIYLKYDTNLKLIFSEKRKQRITPKC